MFEYLGFAFVIFLAVCLAEPSEEEVVYPKILAARGLNGEKILHIRDGLTLSLEKNTLFSENFVFSEYDGVKQLDRAMNREELENNLYHDIKHGSAVLVDESNGTVKVKGLLTALLTIEPLSGSIPSENEFLAHRLTKFDENPILINDSVEGFDVTELDVEEPYHESSQTANNLPEEVYVEVMIISDHVHNRDKTEMQLIDYFAIVMSLVNLKYKELTKPRVQFVVVGITKSTSEPYAITVYNERRNEELLDVCETLKPLKRNISSKLDRRSLDALVYVSGMNFVGNKIGCAYLGTLCQKNGVTSQAPRGRNYGGAAHIIGHELGHVLGIKHEFQLPKYSASGKRRICPKKERGVLMGGPGPHQFSECAKDQLRGFLMTRSALCLEQTAGKPIF